MLFRCQPGFEHWLSQEVSSFGLREIERGAGWLRADVEAVGSEGLAYDRLCFAHFVLQDEAELTGDSVNALAEHIAQHFFATARTERFDTEWPLIVETAAGLDGLGRRADGVVRALMETLKKRMARVGKLATHVLPRGVVSARGLYIFFVDFRRVFVARSAFFLGQRRMADDPLAPSRSYLKIEEAYGVLGRDPAAGQTVVDLGAAPGGWSYSAAKRGAHVIAVDNGPLKGGALNHPHIEHRREDAFRFVPREGERYDWMFCDLVEEPHHVMRNLVEPWLTGRWCKTFVVILKFGRVNPVALLRELQRSDSVLSRHAEHVRIRHLFHDREEFTIVGVLKE